MTNTVQTLEISLMKGINLLEELTHTAKHEEFLKVSLLVGMAVMANESTIKLSHELIETFNFFNDVGMI